MIALCYFSQKRPSLIYKPIRKKGRSEKLLHRWMGPYVVIRQTTPVNYEVKLQVGKQKSC